MPNTLPYNDYGIAMRKRMGGRVQKLAIDAALGCPNRDGTVGSGGCTFCLNEAFSPSYCRHANSITEQLNQALDFHLHRGRSADYYLAYFQSGTNTHATTDRLQRLYNEALSHPKISGIVIGTRPDCIDSEKLELISDISHKHYVAVEYGIESVYDATLQAVNRRHDFSTTKRAIADTKSLGIDVGGHLIIGLPNESREQIINSITPLNELGLDFIKFHQLQIYHSTPMAKQWLEHPEDFLFANGFNKEQYIELIIDIIRRLHPDTAIERFASQAPRNLILHSPLGGVRIDTLRNDIVGCMQATAAKQGDLYLEK